MNINGMSTRVGHEPTGDAEEVKDIMASEEARYFGLPCKLQIWHNEHYSNVEILSNKGGMVHFKFNDGDFKTMDLETFCRNFKFKDTLY